MPQQTPSAPQRTPSAPLQVLIAGGGIAAAEALIALRSLAGRRVAITLLSPGDELTYRPLSVAAPFGPGGARTRAVAELAHDFGATLVTGALGWVAPSAHVAYTADGRELRYDVLVVATGAQRVPAHEHALTFRGHEDVAAIEALCEDVRAGRARRIAFVVPTGVTWSLPLYELALMLAAEAGEGAEAGDGREPDEGRELTFVTPEEAPLAVFGAEAGAEVGRLLESAGIGFVGGVEAAVPEPGVVRLGARTLACDRVVALPRLTGTAVRGLPADDGGFLRVTPFGHVLGVKDVYAAGDGVAFPIKQGGVACQQADVVAQSIARRAGAAVTPTGYRPVLRGKLLTGARPRWLRHDPGRAVSEASDHVLWWPPGKVAGHYLAPYLGEEGDSGAAPVKGRMVISTGRDRGEVRLLAV